MWLIGWNCDWLGIDNFLYTAFFGYRGDPVGPNPEYGYKNDAMNQAMLDALAATDEATQEANWEKAQQLIAADLPDAPDRVGQDPVRRRDVRQGLRALAGAARVLRQRLARQVAGPPPTRP